MFRFIGFIVGLLTTNFLGGVVGWIIGFFLDRARREVSPNRSERRDNFINILLILTAAVAKTDDGRMLRSELHYIKNYLLRTFGPDLAQKALFELRDILDKDYDIAHTCYRYGKKATIQEKLMILQFLFGLAASDSEISYNELKMIRDISDWLGIYRGDFEALKAMYAHYSQSRYYSENSSYQTPPYSSQKSCLENDYKILEIDPTATDAEVKKAYRTQAMKHHPDKVNHLGEEIRKAAEEKFAKLNQSYERIKKGRGMG